MNNTILIATDFSDEARNACVYGIQLALRMSANVILCHIYDIRHDFPSVDLYQSSHAAMLENKDKLNDEIRWLQKNNVVNIKGICETGRVADVLINLAQELHAGLIITAMPAPGISLKKLFGNRTIQLSKVTPVPLLVIPANADFAGARNILYASDITGDRTILEIDSIVPVAEAFSSKLYVLRIVADDFGEKVERLYESDPLRRVLIEMETQFEYPHGNDVTFLIHEFIRTHHIDMFAVMPHKHSWVQRLFKKSETNELLHTTRIPIMVLPEKADIGFAGRKHLYDESAA